MQSSSAADIFKDLRDLCREPGFLHAVSSILFRDFFASFDDKGTIITPTPEDRYSRSRLINNEFLLLVGLLVQSDDPAVLHGVGDTESLMGRADRLLEELHTQMETPMRESIQFPHAGAPSHDYFGELAKETIYYGAESAFDFQYRRFARHRYRTDYEWLLRNKGISVRPMIDIAMYIVALVHMQLNSLLAQSTVPSPPLLTAAFSIPKGHIEKRFKSKAAAFFDCFSLSANNSNLGFHHPTAYNEVTSHPLSTLAL